MYGSLDRTLRNRHVDQVVVKGRKAAARASRRVGSSGGRGRARRTRRARRTKGRGDMSDHEPGDAKHEHETPMLHAQEHKGYGEDEGEREKSLEDQDEEASPESD